MELNQQPWPDGSLLGRMSARTRQRFLELGTTVTYGPRQHVFRQGEESHHVLVVLDGLVKVFVDTEFGRPVLLGLRGRGDLLGEMAMLEHRRRSADVVTCAPARVKLIGIAQLTTFFDRSPDAWAAMAGSLSQRLSGANVRRAEFVACPAPVRVGRVLAEIARAYGVRTPDGWDLDVGLTQTEIASLAGVALATFEKALHRLHRSGLVHRKSRRIVVDDLAGLSRFGVADRPNPYQYGIGDEDVAHS